jgi:hypothetical protein
MPEENAHELATLRPETMPSLPRSRLPSNPTPRTNFSPLDAHNVLAGPGQQLGQRHGARMAYDFSAVMHQHQGGDAYGFPNAAAIPALHRCPPLKAHVRAELGRRPFQRPAPLLCTGRTSPPESRRAAGCRCALHAIEARRAVEFSRSVFRRADDAMNHIRREHSAARDTVRSSRSAAKRSVARRPYIFSRSLRQNAGVSQ